MSISVTYKSQSERYEKVCEWLKSSLNSSLDPERALERKMWNNGYYLKQSLPWWRPWRLKRAVRSIAAGFRPVRRGGFGSTRNGGRIFRQTRASCSISEKKVVCRRDVIELLKAEDGHNFFHRIFNFLPLAYGIWSLSQAKSYGLQIWYSITHFIYY